MPQAILNSYVTFDTPCPMIDTTDMTMWFKSYDGTTYLGGAPTDGGPIDTMENLISTTDALQATAANQPTYQANEINGLPSIRFDGVNDFLSVANTTDTDLFQPMLFFFLIYIPSFATNYISLLSRGTSGAAQQYDIYVEPAPFGGRVNFCANAVCRQTSSALSAGSWERLIIRIDSSGGGGQAFFYRNGVSLGTGSAPAALPVAAAARIGSRVDGTTGTYDLVEMGAWNRDATEQEVLDLDCYMADVIGA